LPSFADRVGQGNAFKREEGWSVLGKAVAAQARTASYDDVVAANRSIMAEILYYARDQSTPMKMWDRDLHDDDHFQMTMRLPPSSKHFLLVITPEEVPDVLATFDSATLITTVDASLGKHRTRATMLYDAHGYRGPQTP
jgi:hypothetical protein